MYNNNANLSQKLLPFSQNTTVAVQITRFTFITLWVNSAKWRHFSYFSQKTGFHSSCLLSPLTWSTGYTFTLLNLFFPSLLKKYLLLWEKIHSFKEKEQRRGYSQAVKDDCLCDLFSGKKKKISSICRLLNLPNGTIMVKFISKRVRNKRCKKVKQKLLALQCTRFMSNWHELYKSA